MLGWRQAPKAFGGCADERFLDPVAAGRRARGQDGPRARLRLHQIAAAIYAEGKMELPPSAASLLKGKPDTLVSMGDDPRLPAMPAKPTLIDFFNKRFGPSMHLLQSAHHARKNGLPEKMVLACLLHDISVVGFIRGDHGYWGAQLVEPYVDEEVTWAIRAHQVLRFYADPAVGYEYPQELYRVVGRGLRARRLRRRGLQADARPQVVHVGPADHDERYLLVRSRTCMSSSTSSPTSSAATSSSPPRAWATTTARSPTCGARSSGRRSICSRRLSRGGLGKPRRPR